MGISQKTFRLLYQTIILVGILSLVSSCSNPPRSHVPESLVVHPTATSAPIQFTPQSTPQVRHLQLLIPDMVCIPCSKSIQAALLDQPGITNVSVSFPTGTGSVYYLADTITAEAILRNPIFNLYTAVVASDNPIVSGVSSNTDEVTLSPAWFVAVTSLVEEARGTITADDLVGYIQVIQGIRDQFEGREPWPSNNLFQIRTMGLLSSLMFPDDNIYPDDPRFEALRLTEEVRNEIAPMPPLLVKSIGKIAQRRIRDLLDSPPTSKDQTILMLELYYQHLLAINSALDIMKEAGGTHPQVLDFTYGTNRATNLFVREHIFLLEDMQTPQESLLPSITRTLTRIAERTDKERTVLELTQEEEISSVVAWAKGQGLPTSVGKLKYELRLTYGDLLSGGFCSTATAPKTCEETLQKWGF